MMAAAAAVRAVTRPRSGVDKKAEICLTSEASYDRCIPLFGLTVF